MKWTNSLTVLLVAGSLLASGATGCKKKLQGVTPLPGSRPGEVGGSDRRSGPITTDNTRPLPPPDFTPGVIRDPVPAGEPGLGPTSKNFDEYTPDTEAFKAETVYFEFDKASIKPSEVSKIRTVAERMRGMPGKAVRVEGHCDERGTEEYNRALGERRALSIREALVSQGMSADMIPTITYGEERPAEAGHNEAAWSKNRRGEFILLSPPVR